MLKEFREFIRCGNLVEDVFTPRIAAVGGGPSFSALTLTIGESQVRYGDFKCPAATVLFVVVIKPVNALVSRLRTEPPVAKETRQCPECLSEIPVAARRWALCTTQVAAAR